MNPLKLNKPGTEEPRTLPRERLTESVWKMPAMWVCLGVLFVLLLMLGGVYWKLRYGWREDAVGKVVRLYGYLQSGNSLQSAPPEWFDYSSNINSGALETQFGKVSGFEITDHFDSGDNEEEVVLKVNRSLIGWDQDHVVLDRQCRIESIDRR